MSFKDKVVYQIYPKSFNCTTNKTHGDLNGVIEKLDYLKELGVEYIWLTPIYPSPMNDNGYDVADYTNINPDFGTMEDFDILVEEANKRGIKLMLDMVFNHTSTDHIWFQKALQGEKKYQDYYIFKDNNNSNTPPTNWTSKFGGNAWEYIETLDKYYLHLFDKTQADLNWENPELREEIYKVANFWLEKGVKGFRLDVINLISKPEKYEDDLIGDGRRFYTDGTKIHQYLKELNENTFGRYNDVITVGEMSSTTLENCIKYSDPKEKELSMTFSFHHLKVDYKDNDKWSLKDFDFLELKDLLSTWQVEMDKNNGYNALFWCNHDQPRAVSRFGNDKKYRLESAKMLASTLHMMKGTPYIYQGEEIGMTNAKYDNIELYSDVESLNYYEILKSQGKTTEETLHILNQRSRDNSRTPVQWNDGLNGGFSEAKPWLSCIKNYKEINAEKSLKDKNSIFYYYKKLIQLRKDYEIISNGSFDRFLENHKSIFGYKRKLNTEELICLNNFYEEEIEIEIEELEKYDILISNYKNTNFKQNIVKLRAYESITLYKK
ncbi:alpha,alpha-phosphotrehalase [Psychrilyobacter atlanticus]|uniref:alpha,alpha-phosphotrehalase n=1 Tax=Psychrilyobacter atlanticus TaxID=271091 RepID=UPI000423BEE6|nr:alpha,alpha-phosphotrehalase [Psychrilyobacter atlanticus]